MSDFEAAKRNWRVEKNSTRRQFAAIEEAVASFKAKTDNMTGNLVKSYIKTFPDQLKQFHSRCMECIETCTSDKDFDKIEGEIMYDYELIKNNFVRLRAEFDTLEADSNGSNTPNIPNQQNNAFLTPTSQSASATFFPGIKIPDVVLPKFDGSLREYNDWASLFESMVHNSTVWSKLQKLYLLKISLIGDAAQILRDTPYAEHAYLDAWDEIKRCYDNKRAIIAVHFRDLVELPPINSDSSIRNALRKVSASIRGLAACGIDAVALSPMISYLVSNKLEATLRRDWERSITDNSTYPSFENLQKYLQVVSFAHESTQSTQWSESKSEKPTHTKVDKFAYKRERKSTFVLSKPPSHGCPLCSGSHFLSSCEKFLAKSVMDRYNAAKQMRLCTNCLKPHHKASECFGAKCRKCNKPHNTVLHRDEKGEEGKNQTAASSEENKADFTAVSCSSRGVSILPTAVVHVVLDNKVVKARALIDKCSDSNLVSESFVRKHRCNTVKSPETLLGGIGPGVVTISKSARLTIRSRFNDFSIVMDAKVVSEIPYKVKKSQLQKIAAMLKESNLADEGEGGGEVDLLIGVEFVNCCLLGEKKSMNGLWMEKSQFGWILSGVVESSVSQPLNYCNLISNVEEQLRMFWAIEEVEAPSVKLNELEYCNKFFEETVQRLPNGQFSVALPFKKDRNQVANTYRQALAALRRNEIRLDEKTRRDYVDFMLEYQRMGHMERVPEDEKAKIPCFYLPHLCVKREVSTTTPLRVVFNASSRNQSGCSLNEALYVGGVLQPELFDTLIKFRESVVAFTADVSKMYRRIMMQKEDRDMQRILWRESAKDKVEIFRLTTLTYGTGPASYIATKCLTVLADEIREHHQEEAEAISCQFYMDDLLCGSTDIESALLKQKIIHQTLESAGMPLRKYASNSSEFLACLDPSLVEKKKEVTLEENAVSVLGIRWDTVEDTLSVNTNSVLLEKEGPPSKRAALSKVSKVFDPLGLVAPVTVKGKILMQDLWREELKWDSTLPPLIKEDFQNYFAALSELEMVAFPRPYSTLKPIKTELVGFCDASQKAYCAAVYKRVTDKEGTVSSTLVCAKTRVAPVKAVTIPRLELLGAVMLSKLITRVQKLLKIDSSKAYAFSDSQIVLAWIRGGGKNCEVFVRNRVAFIESQASCALWAYVRSEQNPADLGTRSLNTAQFLKSFSFWSTGPSWIINDFDSYKLCADNYNLVNENIFVSVERKISSFVNSVLPSDLQFFNNFSSYTKCINVMAQKDRFINNCLKPDCKISHTVPISPEERDLAFNHIVKMTQAVYFKSEIKSLDSHKSVAPGSPLKALNVFLDDNEVLRVGGRLINSNYSYNVKHPIVIHRKSRLLTLYIAHIHHVFFHAGKAFVSNYVRQRFWVIGGLQQLVKSAIYKCVRCTRIKAETSVQLMGNLPPTRTNIARPFTNAGVDYAGHFRLKCTGHRSVKFNKVYAAFFVCFVSKAVHIEIAEDLTAEAFINAFNRFISRRGVPRKMYSDNGTNFVGARDTLSAKYDLEWQFSPPGCPHVGGLWEAAVKSGKSCLEKAIGTQILNREEFMTIFAKIEAILNARPLCAFRSGDSFEPLTPFHLLIGTSFCEKPPGDEKEISLPRRYQLLTSIITSFWRRWYNSYLAQLQRRQKWLKEEPSLQVDDVVLVKDSRYKPADWPLGVIQATFPDNQGQIRLLEIRTSKGIQRRTVHQVVKLPIE